MVRFGIRSFRREVCPRASSIETYFSMSFTLLHAPPAGRSGNDGVINRHYRLGGFSVGVWRVRTRMVAGESALMLKVVASSPRDRKHTVAWRCRRRRLIPFRMDDMGPRITRSRSHQIGILEEFTEFGCWLHGAEQGHRALGGHLSVIEEPFQVLTRHSGAGADQVFYQDAARCLGVAEA